MSLRRRLFATAVSLLAAAGPAAAQEPFYKGRTIHLVVGFPVDNSFDSYGRLFARHLPRHLAGNPNIVVQNMPGAGSVRATNFLYAVAPRDGTTVGIIDQAMYLNQLVALPGLQADINRFNWIGRAVGNSTVLFARSDASVKKADDLFTTELIVSASGSASRLNWTALNKIAATKLRLITGYDGTRSARLALERGEVEALSLPWFSIRLDYSNELKEGKFNLLLQAGIERNADLPELPRMMDLAPDDTGRRILEVFSGPSLFGRSLMAPPELPRERIAELRTAFSRTVVDPAFTADAARMMLDLDPLPGERLQAMLGTLQYPPEVIEQVRAIARPTSQR